MYRKNLDTAFLAAATTPGAGNPLSTAAEVTAAQAAVAALQPMEEVAGVVQVKSGFGASGMKVGTSATEIAATAPIPNVKLLLHGNGVNDGTTFGDASGNNAMTTTGTMNTKTAVKKFGSASILGATVASGLYTSGDGNFNLTAAGSDFVFESWVYFNDDTADVFMLLSNGGALGNWDDTGGQSYMFYISQSAVSAQFHKTGGGAGGGSGAYVFTKQTWYHVAWVKTGASLKIFVDGVVKYTVDCTGWINTSGGTRRASVGCYWSYVGGGTFQYGGNNILYIDEVRLSVGTDNGWSGGFTQPIAEYEYFAASTDFCTPAGTYSFAPASLKVTIDGTERIAPADLTSMDAVFAGTTSGIDYTFNADGVSDFTGTLRSATAFCALATSTFTNKTHLFLKFVTAATQVITAPKLSTASTATLLAKTAGMQLSVNNVTMIDLQADGDGVFADISADDISMTGSLDFDDALIVGVNSIATAAGTTAGAATDHIVVFTGATTQTYTLPACATGRTLTIKNRSTGTVTVNRAGADTIDGGTTYSLTGGTNAAIDLIGNGTDWIVK